MSLKIPDANKKIFQSNNSDLMGSLHYTKSINLDEDGIIKLAPRSVLIKTENGDGDFDIPTSIGRFATSTFYIPTLDKEFVLETGSGNVSLVADVGTSVPSPGVSSSGRWWQNLFHVTTSTKMWYKTPANGDWTDTAISLTTAVSHPIEVFRNRNTICVGNGNVVKQYTTAYGASTDLTLPTDYEVLNMSYSNNRMGIITKLSSVASGQNQEAFFFIWNGTTSDAQGGYPTGSDYIYSVTPYKSSWLILTTTGQLKYFNGGGWDDVGSIPFYFKNIVWEDNNKLGFGDLMYTEGDVVYINLNSKLVSYGEKSETYLFNNIGGILCFDLKTGLYHKYAPSNSLIAVLNVSEADLDLATNIFTKTSGGTIPATGNPIKMTQKGLTGLVLDKIYYIINLSSTTFAIASTRALALAGTKIDITAKSGTNRFLVLNKIDYGASATERAGSIGSVFYPTSSSSHLIYGAEIKDSGDTSYAVLCQIMEGFENIGYFVTAKDLSNQITDTYQMVCVKYRPLKTDDSIIVKYKDKDVIGLPITTPSAVTWTSSTVFTTTQIITEAMAYINNGGELECEITAGIGAGQLVKITSITESSGTYTVTVAEDVLGASNGLKSYVLIENWKVLGSITSVDTNGYKTFPLMTSTPWVKFKVELRGTDTGIEEFTSISTDDLKAIA
jgi:hypothetical protein